MILFMDMVVPSYPSIDMSYAFDNSNSSSNVINTDLPSSLSAEATLYTVPSASVIFSCAAKDDVFFGARDRYA